jgi:hypothetical protein
MTEACCWLHEQAPAGTLDAEAWAKEVAPGAQLTWDFNTAEGCGVLSQYPTTLLSGLRAGAKRPTNMSKIAAVIQKPEEIPTDFCERLYGAFWVYTPFDPEEPENQQMVSMVFVAQSYANIHQKLEGFAGMDAPSC